MASPYNKPTEDDQPTAVNHVEYFRDAENVSVGRDMNFNTRIGDRSLSYTTSTYSDNAVHNSLTGGVMYVGRPAPSSPSQPAYASSTSGRAHSRLSSSTRTISTLGGEGSPSHEAGFNTLGAEPRSSYGRGRSGGGRNEPSRTPRSSSTGSWRESDGLSAFARGAPLHPQPYDLTPPQIASPSVESLSEFHVPKLLRGPRSLGGEGELSPEDSISIAPRPLEETGVNSASTPPVPQLAQPEVEGRVQPPAPAAPRFAEVGEQPIPAVLDGPQAERAKDILEMERSTPLDQRTPASGLLSLESPSRGHFNSGPSFDDQSSISDESELDVEALARANAPPVAPEGAQPKLGVGDRFRLWLSRRLEGLARRVAPPKRDR